MDAVQETHRAPEMPDPVARIGDFSGLGGAAGDVAHNDNGRILVGDGVSRLREFVQDGLHEIGVERVGNVQAFYGKPHFPCFGFDAGKAFERTRENGLE